MIGVHATYETQPQSANFTPTINCLVLNRQVDSPDREHSKYVITFAISNVVDL
jgi:hypothetical protein